MGSRERPNVTLAKRMDPYEVEPMAAKAENVSLIAASKCHLGDLVLIETHENFSTLIRCFQFTSVNQNCYDPNS